MWFYHFEALFEVQIVSSKIQISLIIPNINRWYSHLYILSCPCKYAVLLADELVDSNAQFSIVSWIWMVLITQGVHCVEAAAFALSLKLFLKACIHWIDASNANFLSITNFCFVYSLENFIFAINESLKLEKVQTPKAILF